jgi:imidazolonepropionase-like amidohydrolase
VIIIREGRIQAIGGLGKIPIPPGAEVIDVTGRTVLPGFIDGHGHLEDFQVSCAWGKVRRHL